MKLQVYRTFSADNLSLGESPIGTFEDYTDEINMVWSTPYYLEVPDSGKVLTTNSGESALFVDGLHCDVIFPVIKKSDDTEPNEIEVKLISSNGIIKTKALKV